MKREELRPLLHHLHREAASVLGNRPQTASLGATFSCSANGEEEPVGKGDAPASPIHTALSVPLPTRPSPQWSRGADKIPECRSGQVGAQPLSCPQWVAGAWVEVSSIRSTLGSHLTHIHSKGQGPSRKGRRDGGATLPITYRLPHAALAHYRGNCHIYPPTTLSRTLDLSSQPI